MSTKGIVIEKLTVGWLQLLVAAFTVGGFTYASMNTYDLVVTVKAKQEAALDKYVPIIEKLDINYAHIDSTTSKLNDTLDRLNSSITTILALRTKEESSNEELKLKVDKLTDKVTELQIQVNKLSQ